MSKLICAFSFQNVGHFERNAFIRKPCMINANLKRYPKILWSSEHHMLKESYLGSYCKLPKKAKEPFPSDVTEFILKAAGNI